MRVKHLTIGGPLGLDPTFTFVRHVPLLSYHHSDRLCWLWILCLRRSIADERRAIRYFRMRGSQDRRVWQLWAWSIEFIWQDEGSFRDFRHKQRSKLSRLFGINFEDGPHDRT